MQSDPKSVRSFKSAWAKSKKTLDMGKSRVRFQSADDLALESLPKPSPERR
jgi:hypothetical protein